MLAKNTTYTLVVSIAFEGGRDNLLAIDYTATFDNTLMIGGGTPWRVGRTVAIDADFLAQGGSITHDDDTIEVNFLGPTNLFVPAAGSPPTLFTFDLTTGSQPNPILVTHSDALITTFNAQFATSDHVLVDSDACWVCIPTPGTAGAFGLAALVGARRRRM